jgi:hypothetical protein
VKGILHRPIFWISVVLLLLPTAWLAIDFYSMRGLEPFPYPDSNAKKAHFLFSLAVAYFPGLACLFLAILSRPKTSDEVPRF